MLLPNSFDIYVQSTTARPFMDNIKNITSGLVLSDIFGLGGVYNADNDELHITIGQRTGLDFSTVLSGVLGMYRVCDTTSDELLLEIELDIELLKRTKDLCYWEIVVRPSVDYREIMLACVLTTATQSYSTWTPLDHEARTKEVSYFTERFRTTQDVLVEKQPYTLTVVDKTDTEILSLDFRNQDPVVIGDGNLSYTGGGNRYLLDKEFVGTQQLLNQEPWKLDCLCFVENTAKNYVVDPKLISGTHVVTTSASMSSVEKELDVPSYPDYQALAYSVSSPLNMDSTWEWATPWSSSTTQTHTGSMYLEYASTSNLIVELGLRIRNQALVVRESISVLNTAELGSMCMVSVTDTVSPTIDVVDVCLFLRVRNISPGDRFETILAVPQIENTGIATSRIVGNQTRQADLVTWTRTTSDYNDVYGCFDVTVFPAWEGAPSTLQDQYLFDTRDVNAEAGFWCVIKSTGILEFGTCLDGVVDQQVVASTQPINIAYNSELRIQAWFDTDKLMLICNNNIVGNYTGTTFLIPDIGTIKIGRSYNDTMLFNGEVNLFKLSSTPIEDI